MTTPAEFQKAILEMQTELTRLAAEAGGIQPNADEIYLAANDAGQKALDGAADLVNGVLDSVGTWLQSLGD